MSPDVVIISPEIGAGEGGLADYTLRVVEQWSGCNVRFIVPQPTDASALSEQRDGVDVTPRNAAALRTKLPQKGGKVFLQYSAYGFDRVGYPRWLLRALTDWKRDSAGLLVVMLHEIWTFWPVLNKNHLVQQLHRRDLRALLGCADAIFTSTEGQAEHLRALAPAAGVEVLPVGSNIIPTAEAATAAKTRGLAVLFGLAGSRLNTLRNMEAALRELAATRAILKVITIGGGNTVATEREELELLQSLRLTDGVEQRGASSQQSVSELLATATFGISAQDELSITKSGTFMAYAAHGLNILSPFAAARASEPLCWASNPAELTGGLPDEELRSHAANLRAWYERTCSWPRIADRFARALRLDVQPTATSAR